MFGKKCRECEYKIIIHEMKMKQLLLEMGNELLVLKRDLDGFRQETTGKGSRDVNRYSTLVELLRKLG